MSGPHPSGPPTLRAPFLRAPPFGPPSLRAEALRASTFSGFGPLRSSFLSCCSFVFFCVFLIVSISCFFFFEKFQCFSFSFVSQKLFFLFFFFSFFLVGEEGWRLANPKPKLVSSLGGSYYPSPPPPNLKLVWGLGWE